MAKSSASYPTKSLERGEASSCDKRASMIPQVPTSVRLFLNGKIKFTDIAYLNNEAMKNAPEKENFTLDDVLEADRAARDYVIEAVK